MVCRADGPLFFANVHRVFDWIRNELNLYTFKSAQGERYLLLDLGPVSTIDTTAMTMLDDFCEEMARANIVLLFSNANNRFLHMLRRVNLFTKFAPRMFPSTHDAVLKFETSVAEQKSHTVDIEMEGLGQSSKVKAELGTTDDSRAREQEEALISYKIS